IRSSSNSPRRNAPRLRRDGHLRLNRGHSMNWRALHGDYFEGTRVLITGGAGFIGSHLAEALVSLGASVIVLDDLSGGQRDNLAPFAPVDFVEGSVLDPDLLNYCTRGCRWVLHQAALGS